MRTAVVIMAVLICLRVVSTAASSQAAMEAPVTYSKEAGPDPEKLWPDQSLKKAFSRYWGLRFAGMVEEAFALEVPYFQEMVPMGRYRLYTEGTRKSKLVEMEILAVKKQTDHLFEIQCRSRFKMAGGDLKEVYLVERWVDVDGKWFHVLRDPMVFPAAS